METQLGQHGYEAYAEYTGGLTYDGRKMPNWDELSSHIQGAWGAAAKAIVARHTLDDVLAPESSP